MNYFQEDLNTAVITTRFVLEQSPILHVYHYPDGNWQFNGSETELVDEDYRYIALSELLEIDPTVQKVANMLLGFEAVRSTKDVEWIIISTS
jgi:hypothetical protein